MKQHKYEVIALDKLQQYENNTRTHSRAQIAQIIDSIKCFGFTNPVLIDEHSVIIAGHGRVAAANKLGMTEVPCIRITGLTEDEVKALRIADNQLALNAGWDEDMLKIELTDLEQDDFDLNLIGFSPDELEQYLELEKLDAPPKNLDKEIESSNEVYVISIKVKDVKFVDAFLKEYRVKIEEELGANVSVRSMTE